MGVPRDGTRGRNLLLLVIASNVAIVVTEVLRCPQLIALPGGQRAALEPVLLLLGAVPIVLMSTRVRLAQRSAMSTGATVGVLCGCVEIIHIAIEGFGGLGGRAETISTGVFLLGLVLLWGSAGLLAARNNAPGWLAGAWCGFIGMLMVVTYGFSQFYWALGRLEERNLGSPDLIRSGWTDIHAFTIADLFESGFKVLLVGPIMGAVAGGLGALLGRLLPRAPQRCAASVPVNASDT